MKRNTSALPAKADPGVWEFGDPGAFGPMMAELHRRAQIQLRQRRRHRPLKAKATATPVAPQRLLHELQVHQVELELQNEELQEARNESECLLEKYTDLYDFAPVGYFSLDEQGRIVQANLTGAALLGVERSRLLHRPLSRFVAPASLPALLTFLEAVFAGAGKQFCEVGLLKADATGFWASLHGTLAMGDSGILKHCRLTVSDLTVLKAADAKVRVSEVRYRRLFEAAHDGVLILDPVTRKIIDANPFMTKLLGYSRARLIGMELFEIGLLKDELASQEMFRKLKRQHEVRYEDLPLESETGRHQEVEVVANLYQEDGHAVIQCNIRDITERKQAEELLRRNQALFSVLVGQAPVGVYVVDAEFRVQQANPLARAAFRNVEPLIGRDFADVTRTLWSKRLADQITSRFRHTLKTGEPYQSPALGGRRRDTGAKETYEWQIQRVVLPDGEQGVVCFFSDITERRRAEATERRLAVLSASNLKLEAEIVRRRAVEQSLKQSQQQQAQLLTQAHALQKQLRHLSRSVLRVQEEERQAISRELHDVIAQTLTGIELRLGNLKQRAGLSPARFHRSISAARRLVAQSVATVHQFARDLRPSVLDDLGLIPALHGYLKTFAARTGIRTGLTACAEAEHLDETGRTTLFRVAQEALTNVIRHARAQRVEVSLQRVPAGFCMKITNDGKSFPVEAALRATRGRHLGLVGMRERLEMVGGSLEVVSTPGVGTTIEACIPPPPPRKSLSRN